MAVLPVEVRAGGCGPLLVDLDDDCNDEAQQRLSAWEDTDLCGSAFDLLLDALDRVCGPQAASGVLWEIEDGEALGDVALEPDGQVLGLVAVAGDEALELIRGGHAGRGVPDATEPVEVDPIRETTWTGFLVGSSAVPPLLNPLSD